MQKHMLATHLTSKFKMKATKGASKVSPKRKTSVEVNKKRYGPADVNNLPINPILDEDVYCSQCEFHTKVRLNMVRHLQQHANQLPVASTAPVNPVPDTNERHFDKMTNLASSSILSRAGDKTSRGESGPAPLSADVSARYPQFVPERARLACGAAGCLYISVDETMLMCHWEALHAGTNDYKCVHCPPTQQLSTTVPLTASRIIAHLKMHDAKLYACSYCSYYHHQKSIVEKHLADKHGQGANKVLTVREPGNNPASAAVASGPGSAPTMDLKPWQCGLCSYNNMLRSEVVDHCARIHHSKFQFKCPFCQWRSSILENVTKHHSSSHPGQTGEVLHFFYRDGSLPNEPDGTPRWMKQKLQMENSKNLETLSSDVVSPPDVASSPAVSTSSAAAPAFNLNLVKSEAVDDSEMILQDLKRSYGEFCNPKGKKYVCPLCTNTVLENKEAMTSHLYEELNYRK